MRTLSLRPLALAGGIAALLLCPSVTLANSHKDCAMNAIERSICVYEAIMADISANYPMSAGGGITALRQTSTTGYEATISREEARDVWSYEIAVGDDGQVEILSRKEGTK